MNDRPLDLLVADDEPIARQRLSALARELGHRVVAEAAHAGEVETRLRDHTPDALLLDIDMPGETGLELARRLHAADPGLTVILVTAHDRFPLEAFEAGVRDYVLKPVRRERLDQALQRAVQQKQGRVETFPNEVHITVGRREERVPLERVDIFIAEGGYVMARSARLAGFVDGRLRDLESLYGPALLRVHRGCLAVKASIKGIETLGPTDNRLLFHDDLDPMPISRRQLPRVREYLRNGT
ncbi:MULTISPECIES: LytTR family DNA-binding domain-containing protein [unclassified Thioalkalivibrio]|uniref:LytR/AlgR family response regulator transcription factor n=1 Tax=unclassified Thioalkalivibrio TaxID=2621013 RepID=UPI000368D560|nr:MULTISPECIES: LytTR family DNA-binding domain-containing protein [unclassified Thioalkalivibrio]